MGIIGKLLTAVLHGRGESYWDHGHLYYDIQDSAYRNLERELRHRVAKDAVPQRFTLRVDGFCQDTPRLEDALMEMGCDDSTLCIRNGVAYMRFEREAPTREKAIRTATEAVRLAARIVECDVIVSVED